MKTLWRIITFTKELWRYYLAVSIFSILVAVCTQLQPLLIKGIIDEATKAGSAGAVEIRAVVMFVIGLFLLDVGQTVFSNIGGYIGDRLVARLNQTLGSRYFAHLVTLPQRYFDIEMSGKLLNQLNRGIAQITTFVHMVSNNFLQFIFSTILSLVVVFIYSVPVGILLLILYPVFIWLTTLTSKKWQWYQKKINAEMDRATGRFAEAIGQIKVVKSFGRQNKELKFFGDRVQRIVGLTKPQSLLWHRQDVGRRMVLNVIFLGVFAFIFINLARGNYTVGTAVLLLQYAMNIRIPIFSISFLVDNAQRAISNTREYFSVMDESPEVLDESDKTKLVVTDAKVEFNKVHFGYEEDQAVFRGLSFELTPGSKSALVGESGEGKTTIISLLLGMYNVRKGQVTIDGQDITTVTKKSLRDAAAVVFQEPALFSGSIRENIAYGKPDATIEEVKAAAQAANADEFISKLSKGYGTQIGERGLKLSGGQKQRIAIARALLKDAPILILDEATSSLDTRSERLVQQALERLMKGRTTLIIAHRLSTIQTVDQIITLSKGRVDEVGSPEDLSKTNGIYAQLLELQDLATETSKTKLKAYEMEG